ncbi:MAG TPA: aldehyde ferredoxin oxidoreductase C-terminal domain-containing protein, partial [Deltaproteobacteria bacterium]|nr:aldehyde ferredoxin oxidoreductase C-terminal domain-containing protein [Deltaproteobacteria bacterium]
GLPSKLPFQIYTKNSRYVPDENKAKEASACSRYMAVVNGSGLCLFGVFLGVTRTPTFDWLNAVTGWNKAPEEYLEIGWRIQTLRQAFNIRHGIDPNGNKLHDRALGRPPLVEGANKNRTVLIEEMMRGYWSQLGWDESTGRPLPETLERLGIEAP